MLCPRPFSTSTSFVTTQAAAVEQLNQEFGFRRPLEVAGLREFTGETCDWTHLPGAVKFVRVLAPSMLMQNLLAWGAATGV